MHRNSVNEIEYGDNIIVVKNSLAIDNSYWVIPGRFRAGEHPRMNTDAETRGKLQWLMENGINFIIDLSESMGSTIDYPACIIDTATLFNQQVTYKKIPLKDFSTPPFEKMVEILDIIDIALSKGKNIYLHCYAGMGRTGMIVGCYLARHGISGNKAFEKILELRKGLPDERKPSPETEGQRRMVKEWMKGR